MVAVSPMLAQNATRPTGAEASSRRQSSNGNM